MNSSRQKPGTPRPVYEQGKVGKKYSYWDINQDMVASPNILSIPVPIPMDMKYGDVGICKIGDKIVHRPPHLRRCGIREMEE